MTDSQRVLITGAASGLGRELALACARRGYRIALSDLELESVAALGAELAGAAEIVPLALDVRREADFEAAAAELDKRFGGIDVLFNNAGVAAAGSVRATPMAEWDRVIDIDLLGVVRGCRVFLPGMQARGRGHIVNIASFAGIANGPGMAAYNAAKAGVISLSESLRLEAGEGVGVSVVCPAFFRTNIVESMRGHSHSGDMSRAVEKMMDGSGVSAGDVAEQILQAVAENRFLLITHADMRRYYRLKRIFPNWFYRAMQKRAKSMLPRGYEG